MRLEAHVKVAIKEAASEAVKEVLAEHPMLSDRDVRGIITETLRQTFVSFGVDGEDPFELQKDFQHLRAWRESVESVKHKGLVAAVGVVVTGSLGLLWLGFKTVLGGAPH